MDQRVAGAQRVAGGLLSCPAVDIAGKTVRITRGLAGTTERQRVALLVALLLVTAVTACAVHAGDDHDSAGHDVCAGMMVSAGVVMMAAALTAVGRSPALVPSGWTRLSPSILDPPPRPAVLT